MIQIINYGLANLRSVQKGFEAIGSDAVITEDPRTLDQASHIVLPGVGAFEHAMNNLRTRGWIEPLTQSVQVNKKPLLGICLGMQLLADEGTEHGLFKGLGFIPGRVLPMQELSKKRLIPHVGWTEVHFKHERLFAGIQKDACFYFVHSFFYRPASQNDVAGTSDFDQPFTCALAKDNIWATQFHPEKSQKAGLALLKNFASWDGKST